ELVGEVPQGLQEGALEGVLRRVRLDEVENREVHRVRPEERQEGIRLARLVGGLLPEVHAAHGEVEQAVQCATRQAQLLAELVVVELRQAGQQRRRRAVIVLAGYRGVVAVAGDRLEREAIGQPPVNGAGNT